MQHQMQREYSVNSSYNIMIILIIIIIIIVVEFSVWEILDLRAFKKAFEDWREKDSICWEVKLHQHIFFQISDSIITISMFLFIVNETS